MMKQLLTLLITLGCVGLTAQTVDITFQINMAPVATAADGVYLAGGGNFGNPGDNPMTETAAGSDVYEITVTREQGFFSYFTFTNGNCPDYSCKENLAGLPCGDPDNFNDRFLPPVSQDTLVLICFGQCTTDGSCEAVETSNVTFRVDMNDYMGNFSTVSIGGTWNNFNPVEFPMTETPAGSGVYETTLEFASGTTYEYKFIEDGGVAGEEYYETLVVDAPCTQTSGPFTNRIFTAPDEDTVFDLVCFESCESCENTVPSYNVLFRVDMSQYTGPFTTVEVNGSFNNFCGACAPMADDDGDGIYELMISIPQDTVEYIFTLDAFNTDQEAFQEGDPCTSTIGGFTNRSLIVDQDFTLDAVCWESCVECVSSTLDYGDEIGLRLFPNPASDLLRLDIGQGSDYDRLDVFGLDGKRVHSLQGAQLDNGYLDISGFDRGSYILDMSIDGHRVVRTFVKL